MFKIIYFTFNKLIWYNNFGNYYKLNSWRKRGRGFFDGRGIREIHDYLGASIGRSDRDYTPRPNTPEGRRRTATRP